VSLDPNGNCNGPPTELKKSARTTWSADEVFAMAIVLNHPPPVAIWGNSCAATPPTPVVISGNMNTTSPRTRRTPVAVLVTVVVGTSAAGFTVVGTTGGKLENVDGICVIVLGTGFSVFGKGVLIVAGTGGIGSTGGIANVLAGVVIVCGTPPLKTNVFPVPVVITPVVTVVTFGLNCVATGNAVKEGPVNASPRTPTGKSVVMNNKPVKGLSRSGVWENNSVINREICCRTPTVIVLVAMVIPWSLLSVNKSVAAATFGLTMAIPVSVCVMAFRLTTTLVSVTIGLGSTLDWKTFPLS